jgi:disulfide bond formation protein DsbB
MDTRALSTRRNLNFAGFLACAGMMGFAFFTEYVLKYQPCPLCMFQRVTVVFTGVAFLLAALHNPRRGGRYFYAFLVGLGALGTIGLAARHVYVQSVPPGTVPACGAPLDMMMQMFPVTDVIAKVLRGGGECATVDWRFLGLSMPGWVLVAGVILLVYGVAVNVRDDRGAAITFRSA